MIQVGRYNTLKVIKEVPFGMYVGDGNEEILLPKRYVPDGLKPDDEITVFIYHDNEQRLVATTDKPLGQVGEIVMLEAVDVTEHGAFLRWGIMKDVFIALSQMNSRIAKGGKYFVLLYIDERTGRVAATEKLGRFLSNDELTVKEKDQVDLLVYHKTDIGYKVIINNKHIGVLHFNESFGEHQQGERLKGFVKQIRTDNKIDVSLGVRGYGKVQDEESKVISLLQKNGGYLPYNDKTDPETIYEVFGISKKTFKMILGSLYKKRLIIFTQTGIKLEEPE